MTRTLPKISVTLDPAAVNAAKRLAKTEGISLSAWLSRAALREAKLTEARLITAELIAEYESEHGPISAEITERAQAEQVRSAAFFRDPAVIASYDGALKFLDEAAR